MAQDKTEPNTITSPISEVENRVIPAQSAKLARSVGIDRRIAQARRTFASLVAAAENPPLMMRREFDLTGIGTLRTGTLRNFHLADENSEERIGFTVSYEHQGRETLRHVTPSDAVHKALRKALYANGLVFRSATSATAHRIEVEPVVPSWVMITAEPNGRVITIRMHNVTMLGSTTYEVPADAFEHKLVDALVALVSSGDRGFYDLIAKVRQRRG